ncbi:MAG: formate dehydrogenase accessory sulfurtransferase FdhD [Deltaproteobacteria bacterium]|nr:formate dehydrogenase accessory sulfurtransferase FdhD [Deltaproteobacteria bacterium]PWB68298.1 MAG: formate dehydrogenase family accessory protein FdhD [Deltaproteobacteria bacterium]
MGKTVAYRNGTLEPGETEVVREFPLKLVVNGRDVATLICSPHDLTYMAAGFLRMQGFVQTMDDFLMLSVCRDFGIANVGIRGEVPDKLRPVLTSGCGAGISFTIRPQAKDSSARRTPRRAHRPSEIFCMMEQLARLAENYKCHGGIHSAAVGDGASILLYAEDLGRHNTLDRIAGEALLKGIDLSGTMLVTSGRVSTELAAKAAMLDISLVASRTSPTDMAVKMCEEAGIVLVGYARGGRFTIYSCPERMDLPASGRRIEEAPEAIMAGNS